MIELLLGALIGFLFGARHGWTPETGAIAGALVVGPVLYVVSTASWDVVPCWWPWHDSGGRIRKGPGRTRRRARPCRLCGGKDRIRWGSRKIWGR